MPCLPTETAESCWTVGTTVIVYIAGSWQRDNLQGLYITLKLLKAVSKYLGHQKTHTKAYKSYFLYSKRRDIQFIILKNQSSIFMLSVFLWQNRCAVLCVCAIWKRAFWACFAITGSINSGTDIIADMPCAILCARAIYVRPLYFAGEPLTAASQTEQHITLCS